MSMLVLFCLAVWSPHYGKRELVTVLAVCLCVHVLGFHVTTIPLGAAGGLRPLIKALPRELLTV